MNISKFGGTIAGGIASAANNTSAAAKGIGRGAKKAILEMENNLEGKVNSRMSKSIATGMESAILGSLGGGVIGGVAGGIDEDETFIGGAAKGMAVGGAFGLGVGALSGALHNKAGLINNASDDYNKYIAGKIANFQLDQEMKHYSHLDAMFD